jgi:hypothetical protein
MSRHGAIRQRVGRALAFIVLLPTAALAQELEPRAYSASPVGTNFVGLAYGYQSGDVLFDPSLPVTDVHAYVNSLNPGYGRTFGIGGMQGLVTAAIPYAWGLLTGKVGTSDSRLNRSGIGDLRVKLSLNIIGSPALSPQEFARTAPRPLIVGASLLVVAPTGEYDPAHLINIGAHRWAFKPEVGISYNVDRKLYLDCYTGVWVYADNTQFYPGSSTRSQDPMLSIQAHVSYTFNKQIWAALESTWYGGGSTSTNGGPPVARQDNSRLGAQVSFRITQQHSIKASYSKGATATFGSFFTTTTLAYQFLWF